MANGFLFNSGLHSQTSVGRNAKDKDTMHDGNAELPLELVE